MYDYPLSYSEFRDEELLSLASSMQTFMPDAQRALNAELHTRGLHAPASEPRSTSWSSYLTSKVESIRILP